MTDATDNVGIFTKSEHLNDRLNESLDEYQAKFHILYKKCIKKTEVFNIWVEKIYKIYIIRIINLVKILLNILEINYLKGGEDFG